MINSTVADHFVSPSYLCHSVSFFVLYRILVVDVNKGVRIHVVMTIPWTWQVVVILFQMMLL